jgi:hypothetical protein
MWRLFYDQTMGERAPIPAQEHGEQVPHFGDRLPRSTKRVDKPVDMFSSGEELPLFSGTPIPAVEKPFVPQDHSHKQAMLPGMPDIDYAHVFEKDKALHRGYKPSLIPTENTLFTAQAEPFLTTGPHLILSADATVQEPEERQTTKLDALHEAITPYIDLVTLRRLAANGEEIRQAIRASGELPAEFAAILDTIRALLRPSAGERIKSPADLAALLHPNISRVIHFVNEKFTSMNKLLCEPY